MTLSIIIEPMRFSQANRGENYLFPFALARVFQRSPEREIWFFGVECQVLSIALASRPRSTLATTNSEAKHMIKSTTTYFK
jgi:hypothetical protein